MSKLFIGMPVYNGARFIEEAIESLINQTYTDWTMLISDNASEDETKKICRRYSKKDKRIIYYRQPHNIGGIANFGFVLNKANADYFMWAATDDVWHHDFIHSCIDNFEQDSRCGFAFSNIINIDSYGRNIRSYPSFSRFTNGNNTDNIRCFLTEPEIMGKANPLYSIYRLELCRQIWSLNILTNGWGSDMCFVLAALARTRFAIDERVLFQKRLSRPIDKADEIHPIQILNPEEHIFPLEYADEYIQNTLKAVEDTEFYEITKNIMNWRNEQLTKKIAKSKINKFLMSLMTKINKITI
jgi:glycosyltransferase involved in cell wall biosynthesis